MLLLDKRYYNFIKTYLKDENIVKYHEKYIHTWPLHPYDALVDLIKEKKPKHFLEIGVFCGVTSRNVCELLNIIHHGDFSYIGFDLFGEKLNENLNEAEPEYIKSQKFSNPLKRFYYNYFKKENLNSVESIRNFLKKFENNITLIKGDTNITLKITFQIILILHL